MKTLTINLFSLLLVISLAGTSCDPMRRIRMRNHTSGTAEITWTLKEDSLHSSLLYASNTREVVFKLSPDKPGNYINLSYGIGKWSPADVEALADDLESLVIHWNGGEIRLDSSEQIRNYLLPRRKGMDRAKLVINIKN